MSNFYPLVEDFQSEHTDPLFNYPDAFDWEAVFTAMDGEDPNEARDERRRLVAQKLLQLLLFVIGKIDFDGIDQDKRKRNRVAISKSEEAAALSRAREELVKAGARAVYLFRVLTQGEFKTASLEQMTREAQRLLSGQASNARKP